MDRILHVEEENMIALYQASLNGCVNTLNTLIQRDPLILNKVSLTSFSETPLHITALLGHLEFSRVLVSKKPKLAEEVDSLRRTPLHLASAECHTETVKALLQANGNVCLAIDQDERIPLHLAAMRGRTEIIKELIIARQESIRVRLNGDSVLHLCVRYNHLHALKLLVESSNCDEFLNSKDHDDNSILHLAVMLKQTKAIKYLLSVPQIKREVNATNRIGYTALDVLEVCPRDFKCFEIQNILKEAGVRRSTDLNSFLPPTPSGIGVDEAQPLQSGHRSRSRFKRWWEYVPLFLVKHLKRQGNWVEETRGTLMLVATVIATMTFQAGISPPGGVWQEKHKVGTSVLAYFDPDDFQVFLSFNTISFIASVCVLFLVISGFPLTSKFVIWFLTYSMSVSIASLVLAYKQALSLVTPNEVTYLHVLHYRFNPNSLAKILTYILIGVAWIVNLIHIIAPLSWMVKKLRNFICKSIRGPLLKT
ncbi:ankyrin repeat-containing protein BDA1-like [Corylus avellana]|uniref:ankyrin repeat-containing protein BDA1-like n=1 Tax=Corylus avellana TaxID=13451 RepID=UPI001E232CB2|nr:ankyrin repeat-containing protein BDA1-like [Corylus avellana]